MKNNVKRITALVLTVVLALTLIACNTVDKEGLWENATHLRDMELGKGAVTVTVEVVAGENKITFTVKTDEKTLDLALLEHELIEVTDGPYGYYVTKVNGIIASDDDNAYWAIYINGEYAMTGITSTEIVEGTVYKLEYTTY